MHLPLVLPALAAEIIARIIKMAFRSGGRLRVLSAVLASPINVLFRIYLLGVRRHFVSRECETLKREWMLELPSYLCKT